MGSVFKAVRTVAKAVTKPVSKAFKSVAKGIAKVGKATMRGVSKLNQKLGPLGSIAMAIAMPYALGGLSTLTTSAMNSQFTFLKAIGNVGNSIRTGYQAFNLGISKSYNTITNSISEGFKKFAPQSIRNKYSAISEGAKNLFQTAKDTVKKYTPKPLTGKEGTIEFYSAGDPGIGTMSSTEAAAAIERGTLTAADIGKQTLSQPTGFFTKVNAAGVQSDNLITDTINSAYKKRLEGFGPNATRMFNDSVAKAKSLGTYVNDEQIGSWVENNLATKQFSYEIPVGDMDITGTGKYKVQTEIGDLKQTGDYLDNGQGGFRYTGDATFSSEPIKNKSSELMKATKKTAFEFVKDFTKPKTDYAEPYSALPTDMTFQTSTSGYSGTDITGSQGGEFVRRVYGDAAYNNLSTYYRNMNLIV